MRNSPTSLQLPDISKQLEWEIDTSLSTLNEIEKAISILKLKRAVYHDGLTPEIFTGGFSVVANKMSKIIARFREIDVILFNWYR